MRRKNFGEDEINSGESDLRSGGARWRLRRALAAPSIKDAVSGLGFSVSPETP